jgi:hypothetical protein
VPAGREPTAQLRLESMTGIVMNENPMQNRPPRDILQ